jgi:protein pelota
MKAEFCDMKNSFGEIRLFPENTDDLWHIGHLVRENDLVFATTFRSLDSATDKARPEKIEKRPVRLGIKVEKVEFHHNANRLRISGVIEQGPDEGFHHTINLEAGYEISVIKNWRKIDTERIDRAVKASSTGVVHIVAIEEGEAEIYRIRQFGPERFVTISGGSGKREGLDMRTGFFEEILSNLSNVTGPIVIAGPGFIKDDFLKYLDGKDRDLASRCVIADTRRIGRGAVQEVIGQGILNRISEDIQLAREVSCMDELITRISSGGNAAYGIEEVSNAVGIGAAEEVLVTDILIRDSRVSALLEKAENMRAKIVVLSSEFEPGKQLDAFGGIAALLRYSIG